MLKEVVGLELADIHPMRTVLAPPFYAIQADIAMGSKDKSTKTPVNHTPPTLK
jgi:hypothetical protein